MAEYERLSEMLKPKPYLVALAAGVRLLDRDGMMSLMDDAGLFGSATIMNVGRTIDSFAVLAGKADRSFTLTEIATTAGVPYSQAYNWMMEGVITPTVRAATGAGKGREPLFSWSDAFAAGVIGSLRRHGVPLVSLRQVYPLFEEKKKRTTRRAVTRRRS